MNRFSFAEGLCVALIASVIGGALFFSLAPWISASFSIRLVMTGIALGYVIYLLIRAPQKTGWLTALSIWIFGAGLAWFFIHSALLLIGLHLLMIWLVRSLYFYTSSIAALTDLILCALSFAVSVWVFDRTGSLALGIWCLFLIQALVTMIPSDFKRIPHRDAKPCAGFDRFDRAFRSAEWALRKLS